MAKKYEMWTSDTPLDNPIVVSVCPIHYDDLSFIWEVESQNIVDFDIPCEVCSLENWLERQ